MMFIVECSHHPYLNKLVEDTCNNIHPNHNIPQKENCRQFHWVSGLVCTLLICLFLKRNLLDNNKNERCGEIFYSKSLVWCSAADLHKSTIEWNNSTEGGPFRRPKGEWVASPTHNSIISFQASGPFLVLLLPPLNCFISNFAVHQVIFLFRLCLGTELHPWCYYQFTTNSRYRG